MTKEKATNYFLGRDGHKKLNCSQSVITAFRDSFNVEDAELNKFSSYGGGRAPEGFCGAYYAAHSLLSKKGVDGIRKLEREFLSSAGSLKCKEIRSLNRLSCLGCVQKVSEVIEGGLK